MASQFCAGALAGAISGMAVAIIMRLWPGQTVPRTILKVGTCGSGVFLLVLIPSSLFFELVIFKPSLRSYKSEYVPPKVEPKVERNVSKIAPESFNKEVLEANVPVLVVFTESWCGPCKSMAPIIDEIADEYEGRLKVGKLYLDDYAEEFLARFHVDGIPNLIIFRGGDIKSQIKGAVSKSKVLGEIEKIMRETPSSG